jgi:hypothetical protein
MEVNCPYCGEIFIPIGNDLDSYGQELLTISCGSCEKVIGVVNRAG